jgi:hypothetical protein
VAVVGFALAVGTIFRDMGLRAALRAGTAEEAVMSPDMPYLRRGAYFFLWLFGILFVTMLLGQFLTLLLFVALYLYFWGDFGWRMIGTYVASAAVFLYVLFNEVVPVLWYESPFFSLMN